MSNGVGARIADDRFSVWQKRGWFLPDGQSRQRGIAQGDGSKLCSAHEADLPEPYDTADSGWRIDRTAVVKSTCWCEKAEVEVTVGEVLSFVTHSCGRARCHP